MQIKFQNHLEANDLTQHITGTFSTKNVDLTKNLNFGNKQIEF